jgi:hypothetical protein
MKNLSESIKSKIINEDWDSVYLFKYEIKQDPILIHIQLTTAYWNGYGEDDLDFLEEEIGKKRLEYGYYQIKGIARVENKKSNFEIVLKFSNSSSETVTSDTKIRGNLPKTYYPNIIDALCSENSPLYDVSETFYEYKDDIVDSWS